MAASSYLLALLVLARLGSAVDVQLCGRYQSHTADSGNYTFSTNEWGYDGSGAQCVYTSENDTLFTATWSWSANSSFVHSFPNIRLNSDLLPIQLSDLHSLNVTAHWAMAPATSTGPAFDVQGLQTLNAKADVALDIFLDSERALANSTTNAAYEMMVWFGTIGGAEPIGYFESQSHGDYTLGQTKFTLYTGPNNNGQYVYSWLASSNITDFDQDVSELAHYLWRHGFISENVYLGSVQFGTETFHADSNVTFSAQNSGLSVTAGTPAPAASGSALTRSGLCGGFISHAALAAFPLIVAISMLC